MSKETYNQTLITLQGDIISETAKQTWHQILNQACKKPSRTIEVAEMPWHQYSLQTHLAEDQETEGNASINIIQ